MSKLKHIGSTVEIPGYSYKVVNTLSVWSNGTKVRRYSGQGEESVTHNPNNGYRKMIAVLIEEEHKDNEMQ